MRCTLAIVLVLSASAAQFRAPSDVGGDKGGKHPCVIVARETVAACKGLAYGESNDSCNFALCYSADLNRGRCTDVVTDGTPKNVNFPDQLDKLIKFHGVTCEDGAQGGEGIRNARFDCGSVDKSGLSFLQSFAHSYPVSAETSGVKACLKSKNH